MPSAIPDARPWRGTDRTERDALRRSRLLAAGLEVFGTSGYRTSTVGGLCALAEVSTRSFYELFPHREDLLEAVYVQVCGEIEARIASLPDAQTATPTSAWVRGAVVSVVGPLLADVRKIRVIEVEMIGVSARLEERRRTTTRAITEALWRSQRPGPELDGAGRARLQLTSLFIEGGMSEALVAWARGEFPLAADGLIDQLTAVIGHLIAAGPA